MMPVRAQLHGFILHNLQHHETSLSIYFFFKFHNPLQATGEPTFAKLGRYIRDCVYCSAIFGAHSAVMHHWAGGAAAWNKTCSLRRRTIVLPLHQLRAPLHRHIHWSWGGILRTCAVLSELSPRETAVWGNALALLWIGKLRLLCVKACGEMWGGSKGPQG